MNYYLPFCTGIVQLLLLLIFCSCLISVTTSIDDQHCSNPVIFVFGDSNSDTGGSISAYGDRTRYPFGRIFPHPPSDRVSDGRLIIDFLCENVTTRYLDAYLNSLGSNFTNGVNFAVNGAAAGASRAFSLRNQVYQFQRFHNRSLALLSEGSKNMMATEGFMNALYIIDIGMNDLGIALGTNSSSDDVVKKMHGFMRPMRWAIKTLYQYGGRRFWIHNTGPLGCLPSELNTRKTNTTILDQYGCIVSSNAVAQEFNRRLHSQIERLQESLNDTTIVYVDMYAIKYDLIGNASFYGFENPLTACCGNITAECGGHSEYPLCPVGSRYVSWDGSHYTEAANAFVASRIASGRYSTPPLPFNFFCKGS